MYFTPIHSESRSPDLDDVTWRRSDQNDTVGALTYQEMSILQVALQAFRSLIGYRNPGPQWDRIADVMKDIKWRSHKVYKNFATDAQLVGRTFSHTPDAFVNQSVSAQ